MASISRRPNGKWRARYRDVDGREHARHFADADDARRWLAVAPVSTVIGWRPPAGQITLREYAEVWRLNRLHRPSSSAHVETMLRRHVYPTLGSRHIGTIVHSDIQGWVQLLSVTNGLSKSTVRVVHGIVSAIFGAAVRDRRLLINPCEGTRLPQRERRLVVPIRTEQVVRLRAAVPSELAALVTFTAGTGMRQGEVFGLTRDRLRLVGDDAVVVVDRQLCTLPGSITAFGPLKTTASRRVIPLPSVIVAALNSHISAYSVGEEDLVFTLRGEPIARSAFGHVWRPAAKAAGLDALTGAGMHALRHYYASLLIRYGESARTVQARLGHASPSETLSTYAHLWHDSDDRTRAAVDAELH